MIYLITVNKKITYQTYKKKNYYYYFNTLITSAKHNKPNN